MKKASKVETSRATVPDIDFSNGVRGRYAARYAEGNNLVALSPEPAEVFRDSAAVNEALCTRVRISGHSRKMRSHE